MIGQSVAPVRPFDSEDINLGETVGENTSQSDLVNEIAQDIAGRLASIQSSTYSQSVRSNLGTRPIKDKIENLIPEEPTSQRDPVYSFHVLQEWEGYVVSISEKTFTARLLDITNNSTVEDEEAEFSLEDLTDSAQTRICEGAIFRWTIGYHRSPFGTKDRSSRIVFRNLPAWTKKELLKNRDEATLWANDLKTE